RSPPRAARRAPGHRSPRARRSGPATARHCPTGRSSARELPQGRSLVGGDVVGPVAADLVLGLVLAGAARVALVLEVLGEDVGDRAGDVPGFGVPADVIADGELRAHERPPRFPCLQPNAGPLTRLGTGSAAPGWSPRRGPSRR